MAVVCMFIDTNYMEFGKEVAKVKVVKRKMVKNCKNCRCASHYLFTAHERLDVQLGHNEETEQYETEVYESMVYAELPDESVVENPAYKSVMYDAVVYEELLDKSMVETEAYEAVVYDEMSVFPSSVVLLFYPSCPDVAQVELPTVENLFPDVALDELLAVKNLYPDVALDELPTVENLLPDVALDELPVVEDLSASVDTTGNAMPYYLVRPVIRQRYQLSSRPRQNYQVRLSLQPTPLESLFAGYCQAQLQLSLT